MHAGCGGYLAQNVPAGDRIRAECEERHCSAASSRQGSQGHRNDHSVAGEPDGPRGMFGTNRCDFEVGNREAHHFRVEYTADYQQTGVHRMERYEGDFGSHEVDTEAELEAV